MTRTSRSGSPHDLEHEVLARLRHEWSRINDIRLRSALRPPSLQLVDRQDVLGMWHRRARTITLQRQHVWTAAWSAVVDTLRHEMAHQFADEVLGGHDDGPHGATFAAALDRVGMRAGADSSATDSATDTATTAILDRIQKLLALATSSNRHEAELAMATAHRLLLQHNIALRDAQGERRYTHRQLGTSAASISLTAKLISGILGDFFFVSCIWTSLYSIARQRDERILEVYGRPHDVELASWVHDFLHRAVQRLYLQARQTKTILGRDRRAYEAGVLEGFAAKLRAERSQQRERGLVWVGDGDLRAYFRREVGPTAAMRSDGVRRDAAHAAGARDGANLTLHRPLEQRGGGGRALPRPE